MTRIFITLLILAVTTHSATVTDYMRYLADGTEVFSDDPSEFYYELHGNPLAEIVYGSLWTNASPSAAEVLTGMTNATFLAWLENNPDNATIERHKARQAENDFLMAGWRTGYLSTNTFAMTPALEQSIYDSIREDTYAALKANNQSLQLAVMMKRQFITEAMQILQSRFGGDPQRATYHTNINTNWVKLPSVRR